MLLAPLEADNHLYIDEPIAARVNRGARQGAEQEFSSDEPLPRIVIAAIPANFGGWLVSPLIGGRY